MASIELARWTRVHALLMLGAFALAAALGAPWPLAITGLFSFAALNVRARDDWASARRLANAVTSSRLLIVCAVGLVLHRASGVLIAAAILAVLAADGLDGWLARRSGMCTPFGALFDLETDALLVIVTECELWQRGTLGVWIVSTGLMRYVYVLFAAALERRDSARATKAEPRRWRAARYAFAVLISGLILAFLIPRAASFLAAGASLPVTLSFAREFFVTARDSRAA